MCTLVFYTSDFHNSVPFRPWEKSSVRSQEMWALASLALWKQLWCFTCRRKIISPEQWLSGFAKGLVFFLLPCKCTPYFMHEHKDMKKSNTGMCRHGTGHPDDRGYKHKYGIDTGEMSFCVCSCLPTSVHSLKFLKENKELAPVILSFLYKTLFLVNAFLN